MSSKSALTKVSLQTFSKECLRKCCQRISHQWLRMSYMSGMTDFKLYEKIVPLERRRMCAKSVCQIILPESFAGLRSCYSRRNFFLFWVWLPRSWARCMGSKQPILEPFQTMVSLHHRCSQSRSELREWAYALCRDGV